MVLLENKQSPLCTKYPTTRQSSIQPIVLPETCQAFDRVVLEVRGFRAEVALSRW